MCQTKKTIVSILLKLRSTTERLYWQSLLSLWTTISKCKLRREIISTTYWNRWKHAIWGACLLDSIRVFRDQRCS